MKNKFNSHNSSREIKLGAILSYLGIFLNIALGLIYTPWMIKEIGKANFGLYTLVTSLVAYFMMDFGLGSSISKYVAEYKAKGEVEKINKLLGVTTKIYLLVTLLLFVVLIIIFFFLSNIFVKLTIEEIQKLRVIYCIVGLYSLVIFPFSPINGIFIAYERFIFLKNCGIIQKIATVLLMTLALFLGYKLYALVLINALCGLIITFIKVIYFKKNLQLSIDIKYKDFSLIKRIFLFSFWVTLLSLGQRLLVNIVPSLLGIFAGTEEIAVFAIALTIEGYTWTMSSALKGLFFFRVAKLSEQENKNEITQLMIKIGRIQFFIISFIVASFIILGQNFISLWVGDDFANSYYVALLLIIPLIITIPMQIADTLIYFDNKVKHQAIIFLSGGLAGMILTCLLSPKYGALGAGISIFAILVLFKGIGSIIIFSKYMKLSMREFFKQCHLKMSGALILSLVIGFCISFVFGLKSNVLIFIIKSLLFSAIYCLSMWFFALNKDEKNLIIKPLKKIYIGN